MGWQYCDHRHVLHLQMVRHQNWHMVMLLAGVCYLPSLHFAIITYDALSKIIWSLKLIAIIERKLSSHFEEEQLIKCWDKNRDIVGAKFGA